MMIYCPHNFVLIQEIIEFGLKACTTGDVSQTIKCWYLGFKSMCKRGYGTHFSIALHECAQVTKLYLCVASVVKRMLMRTRSCLTEAGGGLPTPLQKLTHQRTVKKSTCSCTSTAVSVLQLLSTTSFTTVSELILPSNSTHPRGPPMSFAQVTRAKVHTKPTQDAQVTRAQTWV